MSKLIEIKFNGVEDFVRKQLDLLNLEKEAEITENRKLQENVSSKLLQEKGVCLVNLSLENLRSGLYGRSVVTFRSRIQGKELPSTNLSSGDIVGIFTNSSSLLEKDQICSGIISRLKAGCIEVALDLDTENIELNDIDSYKILKLANDVTYRRLKQGLIGLENYSGPANRLFNIIFENQAFSSVELSLSPSLLGNENSITWFNINLDKSQKHAVEFALKQKDISIVHGPPGTGKTTTVVEIILQSIKAGSKILVCAPSNVAVDNILVKLISSNSSVKAIRLGHPTRMQESIQSRSLDAILSNSDSQSIVNDVRKDLDSELKKLPGSKKRGPIYNEIKSLRKELRERESKAIKEILCHTNVILTTLTSATQDGPLKHLPTDHFDLVVIDECSQATEAACWLALTYAPRALLAGDHFQLPPTILSPVAERQGLAVTLMERILRRADGHSCMCMLTTQYRMHGDIMKWVSDLLYQSKLTAHPSVAQHLLCHLPGVEDNEDTNVALLLIDTAGCDFHESATSEEGSKANSGEASLIVLHVHRLVKSGVSPADIAIVTPYNLQVDLLRQALNITYPALEIRSVDGFQGREKEAILLTLVRSNPTGQVGFVGDVRRMNVAVSRARRHLCLVTDSSTTSNTSNGLLEHIEQFGDVRSAHQYFSEIDSLQLPDVTGNVQPRRIQQVQRNSNPRVTGREDEKDKEKEKAANRLIENLDAWRQTLSSSNQSSGCSKELPSSLTAYERLVVHQWAEQHGFQHHSTGENQNRRIIVKQSTVPEEKSEVNPILADPADPLVEPLIEKVQDMAVPSSVAYEPAKLSETDPPGISKKSKKKKTKCQIANKTETTEVSQVKQIEPAMESVTCLSCRKSVPKMNLTLHQLRCKPSSVVPEAAAAAVRPKQKSKVKPMPKVLTEAEDDDSVLLEFRQLDRVCSYITCKTPLSLLGQQCQFCIRLFCLAHSMPEIHGCGDAVRRQARSASLLSALPKPKKVDVAKRANLQKKLDQKIRILSTKRTGEKDKQK